jgi:hypothetical protein
MSFGIVKVVRQKQCLSHGNNSQAYRRTIEDRMFLLGIRKTIPSLSSTTNKG